MDSLFLDTNVLLDVITRREPFFGDSKKIWQLVESGKWEGWISAISFNNLHYVVRKLQDKEKADHAMVVLQKLFQIAQVDSNTISESIELRFRDFEDAIQFACAKKAGCQWLLTRNVADYPASVKPKAITPANFLAREHHLSPDS
jgi:predicted nucleic acid-binding protein